MRKISATYIFPGNQPPLKHGILTLAYDGTILELTNTEGRLQEQAGLEQYSGMLVPGFVNAHSPPELSLPKERDAVLREMIILQHRSPGITMQELVEYACLNGARALGISNLFGSFEPGKNPGVNLITGVDLRHLRLTPHSRLQVIHSGYQP